MPGFFQQTTTDLVMDFNLIVSTYRHREDDAQNELHDILDLFGDPKPGSDITELVGILIGRTALEPVEVVKRIKELVNDEPWRVRYILRLIPIEFAFTEDGLDSIKSAAKRLASKMQKFETFRITVERRNTSLRSSEIIATVGSEIDNRVDLENPDWIVLVEIIGKLVGISVLRPKEIFSSLIEKRQGGTVT
ncbi:MAG: THUMP domain-containing protein [Candidatus Nitrosopolaris sp.]